MTVAGKDVAFYINDSGTWKLYACAKSCSITMSTSTVETSVTGSGEWASFMPQKHSWSATIDGVVNFDQSGLLSLPNLRQMQIDKTELYIRYARVDHDGHGYTDEGRCYIINSSDSGSIDDVATFSLELQGSGALTIHT